MNRKTTVGASDLLWFKSSYSDGTDGNSCVELALTLRTVHVRDSKDVTGPSLTFTPAHLGALRPVRVGGAVTRPGTPGARHTSWTVPPEHREDPVYRAAGRRMDFAQTVHDRRSVLGWSTAELARRAGLSEEEVEAIEESGVEPTPELVERLATALEAGPDPAPRR